MIPSYLATVQLIELLVGTHLTVEQGIEALNYCKEGIMFEEVEESIEYCVNCNRWVFIGADCICELTEL